MEWVFDILSCKITTGRCKTRGCLHPPNVVCMHKNELENIFSISTVLRSLSLSLSKKKKPLEHVCVLSSPPIKSAKYFPIKKKFLFSIDQTQLLRWPTFSHYQTWRTFSIKTNTSYSLSLSLKQANINILSGYMSKTQQGHSRNIIMIWFQYI